MNKRVTPNRIPVAWKIAGGRRRELSDRRKRQAQRRHAVATFERKGWTHAAIARELFVTRRTICRDSAAMGMFSPESKCRYCHKVYRNGWDDDAAVCEELGPYLNPGMKPWSKARLERFRHRYDWPPELLAALPRDMRRAVLMAQHGERGSSGGHP